MANKTTLVGTLEVLNEGNVVKSFSLNRGTTLIGRSRGDIVLEDGEVSSTHCQIQYINDSFHVFDLNSTNGTFINGRRVLKSKLSHGDQLRLGKLELNFQLLPEKSHSKKRPSRTLEELFHAPTMMSSKDAADVLAIMQQTRENILNSMGLILDVQYPDKSSEKIEIRERNCVIGRISSVGRFEKDEEISRKHVSFIIDDNGMVVVNDAGSTNGTFVNDLKVQKPKALNPTDVVKIGNTKIRVSVRFS